MAAMENAKAPWLGLALAMLLLALDQATKWWILEVVMRPPRVIPVTGFFNLVLGWNRGISFGLLDAGLSAWMLPAVALVVVAALAVWLGRTRSPLTGAAIGMVIGGALGNVVDRLRFDGAVADFLDLHVAGYHWPAFNVADSGITVGAAILILESLFVGAESHKNKSRETSRGTKGKADHGP